jgi:hypothetical protein
MKVISNMVWVLNILEILACLVSLIYFSKLKSTYWRWLPFYLLFIVMMEFIGRYFAATSQYQANTLLFRYIGFPVFFLFYFYIFYKHEYFFDKRRWINVGILLYLVSVVIEIFLKHENSYWFSSLSYCIANLLLVIYLLIYFLQLARSNDILNFSKSLMFWFCLALFVYYLGTLPFWGLRNVLVLKYKNIFEVYTYVMLILNYGMYSLFIIGIIRCKQK